MEIAGHTIKKENETLFTIQPTGKMLVPVKLFTDEKLLALIKGDDSIKQACNVATLPGILGASIAMPDMHQGYGFPIGGVAAFDAEDGIISPGGIGFDVNCGVRLLATGMMREEVMPKMKELLERLFRNCPVGVGVEADIRLADDEYDDLLMRGAEWAVDHGYGIADDVAHCEANGRIPGAIPDAVSVRAKARGRRQLGTVGAGNHFIEVQAVDVIHDKPVANAFRITKEGQVVVLIHCGSRGFGHEICPRS